MQPHSRRRIRLLALDVDGTVLDRSGRLAPATRAALDRATAAGVRVVLCTGRRYRRALEAAARLDLMTPLVCNSGALVKDPATHASLWRADLPPIVLAELHKHFADGDEPMVSFSDRPPNQFDFRVAAYPTGRALFDEYITRNKAHALIESAPGEHSNHALEPAFHVCAIGERRRMLDFEATINRAFAGHLRTFVQRSPLYTGWMCEVLRADAGKWNAVLHVAALWKIAPEEICAVGDDLNDVPMIEGAGLGVAMGHAAPEVRAAADLVVGDAESDALAGLIDAYVLGDGRLG